MNSIFTSSTGVSYQVSAAFGTIEATGGMSDKEAAAVQARRATLERIADFLDGQTPEEVMGAGATLDQVHGMKWSPDTCGCEVTMVFNHYAPGESKAHRTVKACPHHASAAAPPSEKRAQRVTRSAEHVAILQGENRRKNKAVEALAEELGVDMGEVAWSMEADRSVKLAHAKIPAAGRGALLARIAARAGGRVALG